MTHAGLSPPPGVDAHRRLVEAALARHLELPTPAGEYPHDGLHALWREAERVQRSILGGWEIEAMDTVDCLVQHVLRLASSAEWWFPSDPELRSLAIEETIVHNAYGWTVTSEDAQQAWHALWLDERLRRQAWDKLVREDANGLLDLRGGFDDPDDIGIQSVAARDQARWLDAWDRWAHGSR